MDIRALQKEIADLTAAKGFDDALNRTEALAKLALVHTEVSEATQLVKREWLDTGVSDALLRKVGIEIMDCVIRCLDFLNNIGQDGDQLFYDKMAENWARPYRYGTPYEKPDTIVPREGVLYNDPVCPSKGNAVMSPTLYAMCGFPG